MFLENFKKFISYYGKDKCLKLVGFTILSFFAGTLEFLGVALIYPFIMLIIQPDFLDISKYIHIENGIVAGLLIGLTVLLIFLFKNTFIIFTLFLQSRFVANWKQDIISDIMEYYLYAPYKQTMKISPQDKLYTLTTLVNTVIDNLESLRGKNVSMLSDNYLTNYIKANNKHNNNLNGSIIIAYKIPNSCNNYCNICRDYNDYTK